MALFRRLAQMGRAEPVIKKTFQETKMKLKNGTKKCWDSLGKRLQDIIIESVPKGIFICLSGHGYVLYMNTISDRQKRLEECYAKTKEESKKAMEELKMEVESIARLQKESDVMCEKLRKELSEIKFLKELWLASLYKAEVEDKE